MAKDAIKYRVGGGLIAVLAMAAVFAWQALGGMNDPVTSVGAQLTGQACGPVQNADACTLVVRADGGFRASAQVRCVASAEGPDGVIDTREVYAGTIGGGDTLELAISLPQMSDAPVGTFWRVSCVPS